MYTVCAKEEDLLQILKGVMGSEQWSDSGKVPLKGGSASLWLLSP